MKRATSALASLALVTAMILPVITQQIVWADTTIAGETFSGTSTAANQWISGGSGSGACLTAASSSAANSIPACSGGPYDSTGNGVLRLTNNTNSQSGFAIYNTPVSASQGLNVEFDMYQYGGTGADGIAFFLINGTASPTQSGALGGSLGYSSAIGSPPSPGLVGGYVGVGFDRFGNFSNTGFGAGGVGRRPNSITVRGSEASNYQYVTTKAASGALAVEASSGGTRTNSKRHVRVTISTNNIMSVAVNYFDGGGLQTELDNINLNTINGADSLPATFKFGFSAGTGGSTNYHEIQGLTVDPLRPDLSTHVAYDDDFRQGETSAMHITVSNSASAEATTGDITVNETVPAGLTPLSASGTGWTCNLDGQQVSCTRPGSGSDALQPGSTTPAINIPMRIGNTVATTPSNTLTVDTPNNAGGAVSDTAPLTVQPSGDSDGVKDSTEAAAPHGGDANNDGDDDSNQANVTSFVDDLTGKYVVLQSSGCAGNSDVSIAAESANTHTDGAYSYPAGLMDFTLTCTNPGDTATVTQYYYGTYDPNQFVLRKYNATSGTYQTIPGAVLSSVTIGGEPALKAVYSVTDGSSLDEDGTANGEIVDPAGPAILGAATSAPLSNTGTLLTPIIVTGMTTLAAATLVRYWRSPRIRRIAIPVRFID